MPLIMAPAVFDSPGIITRHSSLKNLTRSHLSPKFVRCSKKWAQWTFAHRRIFERPWCHAKIVLHDILVAEVDRIDADESFRGFGPHPKSSFTIDFSFTTAFIYHTMSGTPKSPFKS